MKKQKYFWKEYYKYFLIYLLAAYFVFDAMFDNQKINLVLILCGIPIFFKKIKIYVYKKRQRQIENEFYKLLSNISMSMSSGMSLENSIKEAAADKKSYKYLSVEINGIYRMLKNNYSPESAFLKLAQKTENSEIKTFSEVLSAGIPAGVNLALLMRWLSSAYRMRFDAEEEISRIINAPKFNNRIIMIMPAVCVVLFRQIAPYYMAPLYGGIGRIIMIGVLLVLILAWWLGSKLEKIEY